MYPLWNVRSDVFNELTPERIAKVVPLRNALAEHGLKIRIGSNGDFTTPAEHGPEMETLGGAETENNLRNLQSYLNNMRNFVSYANRAHFSAGIEPFVQSTNRSVQSALRNTSATISSMLSFMKNFMGRDVKNPVRGLELLNGSIDYGRDPELIYTDDETGTVHTLQTLGENQSWVTWSTHLEDTPLLRRYLRYIDFLASRFGIRLVYCPNSVRNLENGIPAVLPSWHTVNGAVVRQVHSDYRFLYVTLAFDYTMFSGLTVLETEVQPGQRPRAAMQMDYAPIFLDNLAAIVKVCNTLGGFAACKIYYKDYRNSVRSSQAAPSS